MITLEPLRGIDGKANTWRSVGLSAAGLRRFLLAARAAVGLEGEVHVLLADDATLRRLNRTFLGKDKATDVLSFPAAVTTVFFGDPQAPELAGDLAISLEMATRQAARFGHSLRDEVRILLLHGLLHLAGFDHERDMGKMAARELELRQQLGLPASLIARSSGAIKGKGKQQQRLNTGILPAPASKLPPQRASSLGAPVLAGDPVCVAQNDKRKVSAQNDKRKAAAGGDRKRASRRVRA
jgi:probable rRNA maturation factor